MDPLSIRELQARMTTGESTARQIVEMYLDEVGRVDKQGPQFNAVIEINPDALTIADGLDAERRDGHMRGPLHGVPIFIKDNIDTGDRMQTTAGSLALAGRPAPRDAFLVDRLRRAGAIILGKTNLSEWANFRGAHSTSGWSSRGGQTRNAFDPARNPSGSSSGSAVAVAANLCAAAVGTETDGSIISPASHAAIVGLKPTLGAISRAGIIPIAHSQDTAGPMARTVTDAAILFSALVGADPRDPATRNQLAYADYTQFLDPNGLKTARIGVVRDRMDFDDRVEKLMEECLAVMRDCGAEVIDVELIPDKPLDAPEMAVLLTEFKHDLNAYLARRGDTVDYHTLEELIAFNESHRESVLPHFGQELFIQAQEKGELTGEEYVQARETCIRLARYEGIDKTIGAHALNAIVAPSGGPARLIDWPLGDGGSGPCPSSPAAVAGYPHITVPAGFIHGLSVGLSFFGMAWQEPQLFRMAYAFEQARRRG